MTKRQWVAFGAFCLLTSSAWLLPPLTGWVRLVPYALAGITALRFSRRGGWPPVADIARLAVAGVLLSAVPEALAALAQRHVAGSLVTAMLASVPVILVVMATQAGGTVMHLLVPAVLGLGGILLLVPVDLPGSLGGRLSLLLLLAGAITAAYASVWMHRLLKRFDPGQAIGVVCLANAFVALLLEAGVGWSRPLNGALVLSAAFTGVELVLLVLLAKGVEPVRLGARYLVVPLLTLIEGYWLLRPGLTVRMGVGAGLLAGGAAFLLLAGREDEVSSLSLR